MIIIITIFHLYQFFLRSVPIIKVHKYITSSWALAVALRSAVLEVQFYTTKWASRLAIGIDGCSKDHFHIARDLVTRNDNVPITGFRQNSEFVVVIKWICRHDLRAQFGRVREMERKKKSGLVLNAMPVSYVSELFTLTRTIIII